MSESITADSAQLDDLAEMYANRQISGPEWLKARTTIESRLTANRRRQANRAGSTVLADHIGNASTLRKEWPQMTLGRQAAIVRALVNHVTILPGTMGARTLDPARVDIHWRL